MLTEMAFRPKLARFYQCDQIMPIPVISTALKPCYPKPLYPLDLPFQPKQDPVVPPSIVPIQIGEYPSRDPVIIGSILANNTGFTPTGYLLCDGSEVSRDTYSVLFRIIGTYYGDGDYATTFNLPNLQNDYAPNITYIIKY